MLASILRIEIDNAGLDSLYSAGMGVTLARMVNVTPAIAAGPPIGWLQFEPLQFNAIAVEESYGVYADWSLPSAGAPIAPRVAIEAQRGRTYRLENSGPAQFTATESEDVDEVGIVNSQDLPLVFGLTQTLLFNNSVVMRPINAVWVPAGGSAAFNPGTTLAIFASKLVGHGNGGGLVLDDVPEDALLVTLSEQMPDIEIVYVDARAAFEMRDAA